MLPADFIANNWFLHILLCDFTIVASEGCMKAFQMSNCKNKNCSELLLTNGMWLDGAPIKFLTLDFLRRPSGDVGLLAASKITYADNITLLHCSLTRPCTWTNTLWNLNKYTLKFGQIHFKILQMHFKFFINAFWNFDKCILKFGQMHFDIWTNTFF